ncbi:unnamed protein product [Larinioides sclopetarius]|uniref:Uncharacterized protein n=1 Tax=Larinioides sclopetarius TaxID=280406 RepID=A0AAV2BCU5_9ARAC
MDLSFPYSLKHIALVKMAISLCNNSEIKTLIQQERTEGMLLFTSFAHQHEMFEKFMTFLSNILLPPFLKNKIVCLIMPLTYEFDYWSAEHFFLNKDMNIDLQCYLQWRSSGMINWKKTAESLVQNQKLDINKRFLLSCLYCLKDNVCSIWNEMSAVQKEKNIQNRQFSIVEHWVKWLKHGIEINWSLILRNYIASNHPFFHETPLSLSCFAKELTPIERQEYFRHHIRNNAVCKDDLLEYMFQIEPNERLNIFREHAYHIIFLHLEWPYQEQFMYMINSMWGYLRENEFLYLFLYLTSKQQMRWDFDYSKLVQEFWQKSPPHFKEFVRNTLGLRP